MKKQFLVLLLAPFLLLSACKQEDANLPTPDAVMVKYVNKSGQDVEDLVVSKAEVGFLKKGKTSDEYFRYEKLGQQFNYALIETVGTIDGKKYYTASACRGICGTPSAPNGVWLEPGYYKIAFRISPELGGNYLEFKMMD